MHAQKPSSANPTQPNANIAQPIAATDANVAMAFADRMTKTPCMNRPHSDQRLLLNHGKNRAR
jgi:hypothetical protein